jgi:hypothetical protein
MLSPLFVMGFWKRSTVVKRELVVPNHNFCPVRLLEVRENSAMNNEWNASHQIFITIDPPPNNNRDVPLVNTFFWFPFAPLWFTPSAATLPWRRRGLDDPIL